jgi:hypothetical protein
LRSAVRLGGAPQEEIACRAGRDFLGLISENLGLLIEALLEGLLVLDAGTLIHNAVPFRWRKARRNSGRFVIYERIVGDCGSKIDKTRIFF